MRTTLTLDEDVAARLRDITRERGISFKVAVNETLRAGFGSDGLTREYRLPTYSIGMRPGIDLDRALQLDAALEDEEILRKVSLR
ncbi:MAG: antitoxin [Candidatus Limnocylindrales bacterium]